MATETQKAIQHYIDNPWDFVELAVQNNFAAVRNNLTLQFPMSIGPASSYIEVMQLLAHLAETDQEDQFKYAFAGAQVDYNSLTAAERDAVFAFGAKNLQPQKMTRNVATDTASGGTASGFDWSGIIDGLFGTVNQVIDTFGGGNNPAPAPTYQPPTGSSASSFDWTPVKTIAIYVGGAIGLGLLIWGAVAIVKASKTSKA